MEPMLDRFDHLDTRINRWLIAHSIAPLRMALGGTFLAFGLLKFFPGISPIETLATRTMTLLSFRLVSGHSGMVLVATLECAIGLCFATGRFLGIGVWLLAFQMLGATSPLLLFPGERFAGPRHAPTLVARYIIKDVVLVAAGLVIAATWTGARIVTGPQSMRRTLRTRIAAVAGNLRPGAPPRVSLER